MPIAIATIATAAKTVIPIAQKLYEMLQVYRKNSKEIADLADSVQIIASCIQVISTTTAYSSTDQVDQLEQDAIEKLTAVLEEACKEIVEYHAKWKVTQFALSSSIKTSIQALYGKINHFEAGFKLVCTTKGLQYDVHILKGVEELKRVTGETLETVKKGFAEQKQGTEELKKALKDQPSKDTTLQDVLMAQGMENSEYVARKIEEEALKTYQPIYAHYFEMFKSYFTKDGVLDFDQLDNKAHQRTISQMEQDQKYKEGMAEIARKNNVRGDIIQKGTILGKVVNSKIIADYRTGYSLKNQHTTSPLTSPGSSSTFAQSSSSSTSTQTSDTTSENVSLNP